MLLVSVNAEAKRTTETDPLNRFVEARLVESTDRQAAAMIYADALKSAPENALLASKSYVKAVEVGDFELAVNAIRALELRGSLDAEMPLLLFVDAYSKKNWQGANTALLELESLRNFGFAVPLLKAWVATEKGENFAPYLAEAKKDNTAAFYHDDQLLLHYLEAGDAKAVSLISAIVKLNDVRSGPIRMIAARHYLDQDRQDMALQILRFKRTGPEARLHELITNGQGTAAARKITSKSAMAYLFQRLSADLLQQRAGFLALVNAQLSEQLVSDYDFSKLILGQAYGATDNQKQSIASFSAIDESSPYHLVGLNSEISGYLATNQFEQAHQRLDSLIPSDKAPPEYYILKGQVFQSEANFSGAADMFKLAIGAAETRGFSDNLMANYWLALGGAQEQAGQWPEGLASLQKANELQPNSANILNYLGYAQLERRENKVEALAAIEKAYELRSNSPAIKDSLGWAYYLNGQNNRALEYLEDALSGQPQDATINEHLGDVYWSIGRKYEARYAWQSARLFAEADDQKRLADKIDIGLTPDLVSP